MKKKETIEKKKKKKEIGEKMNIDKHSNPEVTH